MVITLKMKLQNVYKNYIKDYIEELKKYYHKFKRYLKKIYRKIKYHWHNPQSDLGKKLKKFIETKPAKIGLSIVGLFLILGIIISIIKPSYAIYQNEHNFSILSGIVGNNQYDYTLLIYIENYTNNDGSGKYSLSDNIPLFGYAYSGYNCKNNSTLIYDEATKYTKVDLDKKDICSIYFDYTNSADITATIMLEEIVNSNTYEMSNNIPYYGYKYSHYECENNSELIYDSNNHKINIKTNNKDKCQIYFKKEASDIEVKLYVEDSIGSNNYIENNSIPANKTYSLNENKSECLNNNERTETEISYSNGYIEIISKEVTYCKVYLDLENE